MYYTHTHRRHLINNLLGTGSPSSLDDLCGTVIEVSRRDRPLCHGQVERSGLSLVSAAAQLLPGSSQWWQFSQTLHLREPRRRKNRKNYTVCSPNQSQRIYDLILVQHH